MNIDNNQKLALNKHVETWLREQGLITDTQIIEISVRIIPVTPTVVIIDDGKNKSISSIIELMPRGVRVRMANAFNNANITTLDGLTSLSVEEMLRWRNVGKLTIVSLGEALGLFGLASTPLACDIKRCYASNRLKLKDQADCSEIKPLESTDWELMLSSIQKVARKHTKTQEKVLIALQKAGNAPINASEIFPKKIHPSWWVQLITTINLRWESSKLPYRMKFTRTPRPRCKWEGKVQIGIYHQS